MFFSIRRNRNEKKRLPNASLNAKVEGSALRETLIKLNLQNEMDALITLGEVGLARDALSALDRIFSPAAIDTINLKCSLDERKVLGASLRKLAQHFDIHFVELIDKSYISIHESLELGRRLKQIAENIESDFHRQNTIPELRSIFLTQVGSKSENIKKDPRVDRANDTNIHSELHVGDEDIVCSEWDLSSAHFQTQEGLPLMGSIFEPMAETELVQPSEEMLELTFDMGREGHMGDMPLTQSQIITRRV